MGLEQISFQLQTLINRFVLQVTDYADEDEDENQHAASWIIHFLFLFSFSLCSLPWIKPRVCGHEHEQAGDPKRKNQPEQPLDACAICMLQVIISDNRQWAYAYE